MKRREGVLGRGDIAVGFLRGGQLLGGRRAGRIPGRVYLWLKKNQGNSGESGSGCNAFSILSLASPTFPAPQCTHTSFFQI